MDADDLSQGLDALLFAVRVTIRTELTSIWLPIQLGTIVLVAAAAMGLAALVRKRFDLVNRTMSWPPYLRLLIRLLLRYLGPILYIIVMAVVRASIRAAVLHPRTYLLGVSVDLVSAWVIINVVAGLIRNQFVNRIVAVTAWTIAALSILRLLDTVTSGLDSIAVTLGGLRVTPLLVLKTSALLLVTLWAAMAVSNFLERQVRGFADLTPSIQVLLAKLIRIVLLTFAVIVVLSSMGIDLSVLAVFSGAVGVGIGFGLQKIVSNLVSGIILLADKSIKPGDIISVGDQFGFVGNMGARYTSVDTRDGREYLIPNEDFITQRVVNWTYSNNLVRIEVKFATVYNNDPRKALRVAKEVALGLPRVLKTPEPMCHLTAFGGSSIEYTLWFWINDPATGVMSLRSEVLLALWDALEREHIGIPKPGPAHVIYETATPPPQAQPSSPAP